MQDPERYETFKTLARIDAAEFIPKLIKSMCWEKEEKILDYGCGAGSICRQYFLPIAEMYNSTIDAIDISEEMLNYAKTKNSNPIVKYYKGNILMPDFPLKRQQYDKIFSIYVIHFIRDYRNALQGFFDLLKPGGELGLTFVAIDIHPMIMLNLSKHTKFASYIEGYEEFIPSWYEYREDIYTWLSKDLMDIGFTISSLDIHPRAREVDGDTLIEMLMALNQFLKNFPNSLLPELKQEYRKLLAVNCNINENFTSITPKYVAVSCLVKKEQPN